MDANKDWTPAYTRCSADPDSENYNRWWADHGGVLHNLEYAHPPEGGAPKWLCRLNSYRLWSDEITAQAGVSLQDKMEKRAAEVLADIFTAMPKDPTLDELDTELRVAIYTLNSVEAKYNAMRPKDAPRMHLRPTVLLLQALMRDRSDLPEPLLRGGHDGVAPARVDRLKAIGATVRFREWQQSHLSS